MDEVLKIIFDEIFNELVTINKENLVKTSCENGKNTVIWPDNTIYKGSLINHQLEGFGILQFSDNTTSYEGEFDFGVYNGNGIFKDSSLKYTGKFIDGLPHGDGILESHFSVFKGNFSHGKRISGVSTYDNNEMFVGDFDENQSRKHGVYYFASGAIYRGTFLNGIPHGLGKIEWKTGKSLITMNLDEYKGQWSNGKKHGLGILRWNQMSLMTIWNENRKNGPGLLIAANGDVFVSDKMFENDQILNVKKVFLTNDQKIYLITKIFNTKIFDIRQFHYTISELLTEARDIPLNISIFHLPEYQIELHTTPIYKFISNFVEKTSLEQEIKSINQVIIDQYFKLHEIYDIYASFNEIPKKDVVMNRLGLWQMFRDLGFEDASRHISRAEKEFKVICFNENDFQEPVNFCNFLKYLLYITKIVNEVQKNQKMAKNVKPEHIGYFPTMLTIFLKDVLYRSRPFSYQKSTVTAKMIKNDSNLKRFLMICTQFTQKLNIRTAFQWIFHKSKETKLLKSLTIDDFFACTVKTFPQMLQNSNSDITNSDFLITPLDFYELFEAVVTLALQKQHQSSNFL